MTLHLNSVEQAISSLEALTEVLSRLAGPSHEGTTDDVPGTLTTKDVELIASSTTHLHSTLSDMRSQLMTATDLEEDKREPESAQEGRADELRRLECENEHHLGEIEALKRELRQLHNTNLCTSNNCQQSVELLQAKQELIRCKETLQAMRADRRRLKSDKLDLVGQMKQLYHTLEDKESELREFIRNYEQRMNEISEQAKKLTAEKEGLELEKNAAVEECLLLRAKLETKNEQSWKNLSKTKGKLLNNAVRNSFSDDSVLKLAAIDGHYSSSGDDLPPYQEVYVLDMSHQSPVLPRASSASDGHLEANVQKAILQASVQKGVQKPSQFLRNQSGNIQSSSTSSRNSPLREQSVTERMALTRNANDGHQRHGSLIFQMARKSTSEQQNVNRISFLSHENYEEKLRTIAEAKELPVGQWKANHVLSWLELDMNMTAYGSACADNIKSGKVLLGLSDSELESALHLQSPLHRRKLRLAIEELRDPTSVQFRHASKMSHGWVSQDWMASLGLPQLIRVFEEQLVDGRLLNVLTRKDLDKYLSVHKKFHQLSIAFGIELLRMLDFNKEVLQERRLQSQESLSDPLVWTNDQVIEWADRVDLHEYSQNLKESGIHGAVLVFDQNFTSDVFASLLGIPSSKSYVRRHLSTELDAIIKPARVAIEESRHSRRSGTSGSAFARSYSGGNKTEVETAGGGGGGSANRGSGSSRKLSFRGSLGKAFGRKSAKDLSCERPKDGRESTRSTSNADLSNPSSSRPIVNLQIPVVNGPDADHKAE